MSKSKIYNFIEAKVEHCESLKLVEKCGVQIDETVIYKGKLYILPSNLYDNKRGLAWLVGLIGEELAE